MKRSSQPVEINMAELRRALDRARHEPLEEADYLKLKVALDVLDQRLRPTRTTENVTGHNLCPQHSQDSCPVIFQVPGIQN